jgi:hypothetical protein
MAAERILQVAILGLFIFSIVLASMLILKWWIKKRPWSLSAYRTPTSFSGKGSIIFLEYIDEDAALKVARKIARETGRLVTVQGEDNRLIDMIPPVTTHWSRRQAAQLARTLIREPGFHGVDIREDLEVIGVANLLARIDVDKHGHWSLVSDMTVQRLHDPNPRVQNPSS